MTDAEKTALEHGHIHGHEPVAKSAAEEFITDVRKLFFLNGEEENYYFDQLPHEGHEYVHGYKDIGYGHYNNND